MKRTVAVVALAGLSGLLGFTLAACGAGGSMPSAADSQGTDVILPSTVRTTGWSSPAEISGDGRYFGLIRTATVDPPSIAFDIVQTFGGEDANRASAEDGGEVPVSNDHYERNPDERTVVLELAPDAWTPKGPLLGEQTRAELGEFLASFAETGDQTDLNSDFRGTHSQYWVTIRDERVVRIDEQYFP